MNPQQLTLALAVRPTFAPSRSGNARGWIVCQLCGQDTPESADVRAAEQRCRRCGAVVLEVTHL